MLTVALQEHLQSADAIPACAQCLRHTSCTEASLPAKFGVILSSRALVGLIPILLNIFSV